MPLQFGCSYTDLSVTRKVWSRYAKVAKVLSRALDPPLWRGPRARANQAQSAGNRTGLFGAGRRHILHRRAHASRRGDNGGTDFTLAKESRRPPTARTTWSL